MTKFRATVTFEYEVKHPRWQQYKVTNHYLDIDFKKTYGEAFEFLNNQKPISVMLAVALKLALKIKNK